uniref:Uncharacterized protein n=1 Tax=Lotus japonicus TaxID=34305 RepID=I3S9T2_LOTJA|nr:unknown [Lotus japonicus]
MVGLFSRFSVGRSTHRRTQSAIDEREVMPPNLETAAAASAATAVSHELKWQWSLSQLSTQLNPLTMIAQFSARYQNRLFLMMEEYGKSEYLLLSVEEVTCQ